jgi:glycosyltransferase involved in cell wall biosynthesis
VTAVLRPHPPGAAPPPTERRALAAPAVDVSVLVPAKDEAENLPRFMELAESAFAADPRVRYEVVVVDDGSVDETWPLLGRLQERYPWLRAARHRARRGIADALRTGYLNARGDVLVFYPADLQFMPEDIPRLAAPILAGESDMVTGYKLGQYEKAFVSRIYNGLSRALFDVPVRDLNNVKAYRREIMAGLPVRPDWHRYMIVLAAAQGYTVTEIPVPLYPRHAGRSKFGIGRIPVGVLDMLAVWFELRFGRKPLLLFGMLGAALFALGVLAGVVALVWLAVTGNGVRAVWTLIQTCLLLGGVFFSGGLVGELIAGQRAELAELRRELDEARLARASADASSRAAGPGAAP